MGMIELLKPDFILENTKGNFVQLVHCGWNQINILESPKGSSRGGHYHKENREAFYVLKGVVNLKLSKFNVVEQHVFEKGSFFLINPMVIHDFYFEEDTTMVSMYDMGVIYQDGTKDIYNA